MPKRKANWWPPSILADPDVLSVDDEGRFVLCKICHVHYAVHGGKKPKPVIMNSNFRTRAWDVHKERTNSHRLQKQQERLQQAKTQQAQGQQTTDTQAQQQQQQQQQHQQQVQQGKPARPQHPTEGPPQLNQVRRQQQMPSQRQSMPGQLQSLQTSQTRGQNQSLPALSSQAQTLTQAPPPLVQGQTPASAPLTEPQTQHLSAPHPPQSKARLLHKQLLPQEQRLRQLPQQVLEETKDAGHEPLQTAVLGSAIGRPVSAALESTSTTPAMSARTSNTCENTVVSNAVGKRPAPTMLASAPAQRRRVFRAGSPGSSMQLLAESEAARHAAAHTDERNSFVVAGSGNHAKKAAPIDHSSTINQQADSSARWRHMHDDVSRALNAAPRRRQQGPASYTSGELRAAKTLVQTETGDLGSNNSERVAKKLRSLNAEYHASNMRHADAYNMRHSDVFDRRSASYKEYWGTLRDVYTTSGATSGSGGSNILVTSVSCRKSHHRTAQLSAKPMQGESKETEADSTTPDDSGSSEEAFRPALVVHDASLISAIERLTDATSKQIAILHEKQTSGMRDALVGLTSVMTDLRVQHGNAFERMIELQEKHLKVMEGILEIKLRKEAARNAKRSFCINLSNGSTTASSSGSSPDTTSNGASGLSSQDAGSEQRG